MALLLNWRIWAALALAVFLAGTHWKAYVSGKKTIQAEWDAEKVVLQHEALEAQAANAETARLNQKAVERLDHDLQESRKARDVAAAALDDSVRRIQSAVGGQATGEASAPSGPDDDPAHAILGQCAQAVAGMVREAGGLREQAEGLQRYAREVCLSKP
ncbi:MAG: hypothetical protein KGL39_16655 [Patescibacteria group bacterium]|nr:hypothetical protein [Patescibacteria group bacterium]